jgi:site-specific DNA-methyltransferase (cytosine-N4-specific)
MFKGDSFELLKTPRLKRYRDKFQMVFTSPPFPLVRKKRYGNKNGEDYINWLADYAPLLADFVVEDGSIVIELGNSWEPKQPTMSTLTLEALLEFKKRAGLYLCQEFICFNPARLPGPAQWVNIERCRVKDAFTRVWWMSKTQRPKADNRKVLTKYSDSMSKLFKKGSYNKGSRPSQHRVGQKSFLTKHDGAITPNVLVPPVEAMLPDLCEVLPISNTVSNDQYRKYCQGNNLQIHPARMPLSLVEFFVEFLTDENDWILDPFAGSNSTGSVAEALKRKWLSIEMNEDYIEGSKSRFAKTRTKK